MTDLSVHYYLYLLHEELAPFRRDGGTLSGASIAYICKVLSACAAEAEQMAILLRKSSPVIIDPNDEKVVCIARYRSRPRSPAPLPPGGGTAA